MVTKVYKSLIIVLTMTPTYLIILYRINTPANQIRGQKQDNTCSRYLGTFEEKEPESP